MVNVPKPKTGSARRVSRYPIGNNIIRALFGSRHRSHSLPRRRPRPCPVWLSSHFSPFVPFSHPLAPLLILFLAHEPRNVCGYVQS